MKMTERFQEDDEEGTKHQLTILLTSGKWSNWDPEQSVRLKILCSLATPAILSHRTETRERNIYYTPAETKTDNLFDDNIKSDRTDEDLLFQVMVELGIELSVKIEKLEIAGKAVWNVDEGYLLACFDEDVNETAIKEIAKMHPYYFVMRDHSLATDNVADNFEQIFEEYSKDTIRKIL
jgi:hypothetical protein